MKHKSHGCKIWGLQSWMTDHTTVLTVTTAVTIYSSNIPLNIKTSLEALKWHPNDSHDTDIRKVVKPLRIYATYGSKHYHFARRQYYTSYETTPHDEVQHCYVNRTHSTRITIHRIHEKCWRSSGTPVTNSNALTVSDNITFCIHYI